MIMNTMNNINESSTSVNKHYIREYKSSNIRAGYLYYGAPGLDSRGNPLPEGAPEVYGHAIPDFSPLSRYRRMNRYKDFGNRPIEEVLPLQATCRNFGSSMRYVGDMTKMPAIGNCIYTTMNTDKVLTALILHVTLDPNFVHDKFRSIRSMLSHIPLPPPNIIAEERNDPEFCTDNYIELVWLLNEKIDIGTPESRMLGNFEEIVTNIIERKYHLSVSQTSEMLGWNNVPGIQGIWQYRNHDWAYTPQNLMDSIKRTQYNMGYGAVRKELKSVCRKAIINKPDISYKDLQKISREHVKVIMANNENLYPDVHPIAPCGVKVGFYKQKPTALYGVRDFPSFHWDKDECAWPYNGEEYAKIVIKGPFYRKMMSIANETARYIYNHKDKVSAEKLYREGEYLLNNRTPVTPAMRKKATENPAAIKNLVDAREMRIERKKRRTVKALELRKQGYTVARIAAEIGVLPRQVKRWFKEVRDKENELKTSDDDDSISRLTAAVEINVAKDRNYFIKDKTVAHECFGDDLKDCLADLCATILKGIDLGVQKAEYRDFVKLFDSSLLYDIEDTPERLLILKERRNKAYYRCLSWIQYALEHRRRPNRRLTKDVVVALKCSFLLDETHEELKQKFLDIFNEFPTDDAHIMTTDWLIEKHLFKTGLDYDKFDTYSDYHLPWCKAHAIWKFWKEFYRQRGEEWG